MPDRKYRQSGYMDSEPRERSESPRPQPKERSGAPWERPDGPRGRGLGAPTESVFRCRRCGARQRVDVSLPFDAVCEGCSNDLHTCSNCIHFDTSRPKECRKPVTERVANKIKRNECELFTPGLVQEFAKEQPAPTSRPRDAFDALFKKK
ncbi:MAG: hypothetical protein AB2L07_05990 [Thermoanaerobaculaceae bacterium]